jgi:predicted phosphodiesterase
MRYANQSWYNQAWMRILTISDIHGQYEEFNLEKLPEADVILVVGDLTNYGMRPPFGYQLQAERELEMARDWFEQLHAHCPRILWVQGNHDIDMPDDFLEPFAQNIRDQSITLFDPKEAPTGLGSLEHDGQIISVRGVSLTCAFDKPYLAQQWAFTTTNPLVHHHLDFYALLRMLRNPLALHWTLLPLVG